MNRISAVYKIQSKLKPERIYIGSAVNIHGRWWRHIHELKRGVHHSSKLQNHCNKYGIDDLIFSVLMISEKHDLITFEQSFIDSLEPYFNECKIAGSPLGLRRSEEFKEKCRKSAMGRKMSEEARSKMSIASKGRKAWNKGKHWSEEHKRILSEVHKGQIVPEHVKKERSIRMMGDKNRNYGGIKSEIIRGRMRESALKLWKKKKAIKNGGQYSISFSSAESNT